MKSLILYGARKKLTKAHTLVSWKPHGKTHVVQPKYYVRVSQFDGDDLSALANAKPMKGESVLNTVEI